MKKEIKKLGSVACVLDYYFSEHVVHSSIAWERAKYAISKLCQHIGSESVNLLDQAKINIYTRLRGKDGVSSGTIRRELTVLIAALNFCKSQKAIDVDLASIRMPSAPPPKDVWLNKQELEQLLNGSYFSGKATKLHKFIEIASATAARKTSILTLKWEQVDEDAGVIHFEADGKVQKGKRRVPVPMSDRLRKAMAAWDKDGDFVIGDNCNIQRDFGALCERLSSVHENQKFLKVTPHTLRHTWATLAARAGIDMWQIAGVLGDTIQTVTRNYLHHCPEHLRKAVNFM